MDSGFRRNDEPKPHRLTLSSGEAAYRRARAPHLPGDVRPSSFDTALARLLRMRRLGRWRARPEIGFFNTPPSYQSRLTSGGYLG